MGLRQFFKRILPPHNEIRSHRHLQFLGDILHDPEIFHLTRHSAAGGVANGLFLAFLPIPGQMATAALVAILLRINLPISVVLVWITNPVTAAPIYFLAYETGRILLGGPPQPFRIEFSLEWLGSTFLDVWPELLLGCLVFSTVAALLGYAAVQVAWRAAVQTKWRQRRDRRNSIST